jgi:hypothetical protein
MTLTASWRSALGTVASPLHQRCRAERRDAGSAHQFGHRRLVRRSVPDRRGHLVPHARYRSCQNGIDQPSIRSAFVAPSEQTVSGGQLNPAAVHATSQSVEGAPQHGVTLDLQ